MLFNSAYLISPSTFAKKLQMKRWLPAFLLMAACASSEAEKTDFPKGEIFEQKLGSEKVYGLRIYDFAIQNEPRTYALRLELAEKVWTDTLHSEVYAKDTMVNEVIFSEAPVQSGAKVNYRIQILDAE